MVALYLTFWTSWSFSKSRLFIRIKSIFLSRRYLSSGYLSSQWLWQHDFSLYHRSLSCLALCLVYIYQSIKKNLCNYWENKTEMFFIAADTSVWHVANHFISVLSPHLHSEAVMVDGRKKLSLYYTSYHFYLFVQFYLQCSNNFHTPIKKKGYM